MSGQSNWTDHPDHYFFLEGRTLSACMAEVRNLLDGQYMTYEAGDLNVPGRMRVDQNKIRDIGLRLQALLNKAEGIE